jgi:hypothetical protein
MDFDSEDTQNAFLDLVRKFAHELKDSPRGDLPSIESDLHSTSSEPKLIGPHDLEDIPLNFGDIPAVQERFYTLLKNRLSLEIEQNPPLFPWEDEVLEYQSDSAPSPVLSAPGIYSAQSLWLAQLRRLMTPVALPEAVLGKLLATCESIAQTSLLEGAKLVKVVEEFFPDRFLELNQLAGVVMMSPVRDGYSTLQSRLADLGNEMPSTYEDANSTQQMVLSLLAARELLSALSLTATANQPRSQQWVTEIGALTLDLDYRVTVDSTTLRIQGQLPCGGTLALTSGGVRTFAQRPEAGILSVELADLLPNQRLQLTVQLGNDDRMTFAILPQA